MAMAMMMMMIMIMIMIMMMMMMMMMIMMMITYICLIINNQYEQIYEDINNYKDEEIYLRTIRVDTKV